ncbi:MAG: pyruvate kinase [Phycisphaerales bacterium]|nr:pyruvate kinase [Phycisphaerales bacterium]MCB9862263.1 pyruvate kinase [Phycisphaerales bacterium]
MIQTKIVATLGPATDSVDMILKLMDAGVDVFRLNFSHGTLEQHAATYRQIRKAREQSGEVVAVMGDLCGPKIRIDPLEDDEFDIARGDLLEIVAEHMVGGPGRVSTNRPELIKEVQVGHRVLIDDGMIQLRVKEMHADRLNCVCEIGGTIRTRKGLNLPDSDLAMSALTDKDREDLAWALENDLDYVALSFVRSAKDLHELRELMPLEDRCRIVAKIETVQAIKHMDQIIEASDVILVARGDLGVEMDLARVPILQKRIVRQCQNAGKPCIVATQMLQSMVDSPVATRAEVSDVANAILDKADCVMLSAETSIGSYPLESVEMLSRTALFTEDEMRLRNRASRVDPALTMRRITTAVAHGASLLARELEAKVVAVWTDTGNTARLLSKTRLGMPVIGLSSEELVCRRMAMYFGVIPVCMERHHDILHMLKDVDVELLRRNLVKPGELIVVVAGTRLEHAGATNALLIHLVSEGDDDAPVFA